MSRCAASVVERSGTVTVVGPVIQGPGLELPTLPSLGRTAVVGADRTRPGHDAAVLARHSISSSDRLRAEWRASTAGSSRSCPALTSGRELVRNVDELARTAVPGVIIRRLDR